MSQAGIVSTQTSPPPPSVATSYVTDSGTAVPALNILIVHGVDSTENNDNGIIAKGGVVGTGSSNEVDIVITNRVQGTTSTVGAVTGDVITFALAATPAGYKFYFNLIGFSSVTPAAAGYDIDATARTTGAAATVVGTPDADEDEDTAFTNADWDVISSGNSVILRVTGVLGITIQWSAVGYYVMAS